MYGVSLMELKLQMKLAMRFSVAVLESVDRPRLMFNPTVKVVMVAQW